jgi:leucyl-tRNA synthetase
MGVSFIAIAIEHPISQKLAQSMPEIKNFIQQAKQLAKGKE